MLISLDLQNLSALTIVKFTTAEMTDNMLQKQCEIVESNFDV